MSYSQQSRRSHEESQHSKQAGDRVWMEQLEGRLMLDAAPDATALDMSVVNHLVGTVPALYRFDVQAGEKFLILDNVSWEQVHLLDAQQREIAVVGSADDYVGRLAINPKISGTYYLSIQEANDETDYDVIVRQAQDDYGNRPATAPTLVEGQVINGEIEDYQDRDLFRFDAVAGERYVFGDLPNQLWFRILDGRGREVTDDGDGSEPMPYTGTYYVQICGDNSVGTYALSFRRAVDDNAGDMAHARQLTIGTPIHGTIDYGGDSDWFVFHAVAGTTYEFGVDNNYLAIYAADGSDADLVGDWYDDDDNYTEREEWIAPSDGLYYVNIEDDGGPDYWITSAVLENRDPTMSGNASPFGFDGTVQGSIDAPAQSEYFSFTVTKNATYSIGRKEDDGVLLALVAPDGKTILDADFHGVWTATEGGTYFLWARAFDPVGTVAFSFNMSQELDDYGNSASEVGPIEMGQAIHGSLQYSWDEDWFSADVTQGEHYVFNLGGPTAVVQPVTTRRKRHSNPSVVYLSIQGSDGKVLGGYSVSYSNRMKIEWTAPISGRVYIRIGQSNASGGYTLNVAKAADDPQPAKPLAIGGIASGSVSAGSVERFRIELEAGKAYVDPMVGNLNSAITPIEGNLGQQLQFDYDYEHELTIMKGSGAYFIQLFNSSEAPVEYSFQVMEYQPPAPPPPVVVEPPVQEDAPPPVVVEAKRAELPFELADEDDVRAFSFTAEAGKNYVFKTILGSLEDSTLSLYDGDGQYLDDNDDVSDDDYSSKLEWTAEASGTYFIVVGGFGGGSFDLSAHEGSGAKRKELKLEALAVADARMRFAENASGDEDSEEQNDDAWLSDDSNELDWGDDDVWAWDI